MGEQASSLGECMGNLGGRGANLSYCRGTSGLPAFTHSATSPDVVIQRRPLFLAGNAPDSIAADTSARRQRAILAAPLPESACPCSRASWPAIMGMRPVNPGRQNVSG
jgi:hypothetical protein